MILICIDAVYNEAYKMVLDHNLALKNRITLINQQAQFEILDSMIDNILDDDIKEPQSPGKEVF